MSTKKTSKSGPTSVQPVKKSSRSSTTQNLKQAGNSIVDEGNHGILEGISSLHSWIKTQTMIRPSKVGGVKVNTGFDEDDEDDDVVISLTSKDPNISTTQVRWDHTMSEFVGVHLTETLIDHLEIESTILHVNSEEAKIQMMEQRHKADLLTHKSKMILIYIY